jgi:outer membrane biosynthesis protein TonB
MPVLASSSMLEPGLIGLWRPVLVVPQGLTGQLAPAEIEALIAHEACHLRRRDNLAAAVHMLVEALFWFHPMVWWIGARLIAERERACDEAVLKAGCNRAAYARCLVECCRHFLRSPLPCVAGASGSNLAKRVERIMTAPSSVPLSRSARLLLLGAGLCALASPVAAGWLTSPAGQAAAARVSAIVSVSAPGPQIANQAPKPIPAARMAPSHAAPEIEAPAPIAPQNDAPPEPAPPPPAQESAPAATVTLASAADVSQAQPVIGPIPGAVPEVMLAASIAPATAKPLWVRLPPATWTSPVYVYPMDASRRDLPGRASLRCRVDSRGGLVSCHVTSESPAGEGFGDKALYLALDYRARTLAADGRPVQGRLVDVTVDFTPKYWARIVEDRHGASGPPPVVRWRAYPAGYYTGSPPPPVYPLEAHDSGLAGEVILHCKVKPDGYLDDCAVARETPQGLGFGRVALNVHNSVLRVDERARDGTPMAGRVVEVRYVINPPCGIRADDRQTGCAPGRGAR